MGSNRCNIKYFLINVMICVNSTFILFRTNLEHEVKIFKGECSSMVGDMCQEQDGGEIL